MIISFGTRDTERIWNQQFIYRLSRDLQVIALRELFLLHRAKDLYDLRVPPGNRLERLSGDRKGAYSIRVKEQWQICFVWEKGNAHEVEIIDYH